MNKKKKLSIKDMSVKGKIIMFSGVMLVFMVAIAGTGLFASNTISNARKDRYNNYAMSEYNLSEAFSNFANIKVRIRNMPIMYFAPDVDIEFDDQVTKINNYEKAMNEYFQKFEETMDKLDNPDINAKYKEVKEDIESWMANTREDIELFQQNKTSSNTEDYDEAQIQKGCDDLMQNGRQIADKAEAALEELVSLLEEASAKNNDVVENELVLMEGIMIAVSVIAVIVTLIYAMLLVKLITVPVRKLTEGARKLAVGDIDVDCEKLANDDLGELLDDFGHMVDAIKEQANIAQHLSTGDMTVDVVPRSDKDVLGIALKRLEDDQNKILSDVKESTGQVTVGAEQVAMASQSLAQGATEQASALEEVTVSMSDIAERTKQNASEANKANDLVHSVKETAVTGNTQMRTLKEAMDDINKTSEMISKIIKTIDDIAFQTNILALNAAVEAARAGIHGKGFSVVAEEVRNLAGKCGTAAGEITEMIEDAIRKIQNGADLATDTEKYLGMIVTSVEEVVELVNSIATASNDQATAVSQVDQAIGQVSQVVQTNSATSQQCAAASEELSNQAANLRNLMANFKLRVNAGGPASMDGDLGFGVSNDNYNEKVISLDGEFGKY